MKRLLTFVALLFCFTSCGVTSLYYWGGSQNGATAYENLTYKNYDKQTPESLCKLICMYEDIISNTGGKRQLPPPGICAEYGYLLLIPENAVIFAEHATAMQKRLLYSSDYPSFFLQRARNCLKRRLSCILNRQNSLPLSLIDSVNELSYEKDYILLAFLLRNNFLWLSENGYQRVSICEDV